MNLPFSKIQLLRASYTQQFQYAVESDQGLRNGELLRLTGPAIFLDRISANGRKYMPEYVHAQVAELQPRIAKRALFGVLDHPDVNDINKLAYVKMTDVSHRIDAMWYNEADKTYYVTVTVLDTPNGRILKAIHDAGSPLYISLRSILDPSKTVQRNGYAEVAMLALITLDMVSRPGFADAELKAMDISNESALAVCESLNLFNQQRIFDSMKQNKQNKQYIPAIAMESVTGVATQPTEDFSKAVKAFIADVRDKLPNKFTASDFAKQYPDSMFNGHIIGLYEATKELMITDVAAKTCAIIALTSDIDGEYTLDAEPDVQYYNTEIADNSVPVQGNESAEYPIIASEDYEPSTAIMETAQRVLDSLQTTYADKGFSQTEFNTDIAENLSKQFGVSVRIDDDHEPALLRIVSEDGNDGAAIELIEEDDNFKPVKIAEYWKPGTESEGIEAYVINDDIKLIDASGDTIAEGKVENMGTFGELKDTIKAEDQEGFDNMTFANISDETEVVKINGDWYYIEDGMSVECNMQAGNEADELCTLTTEDGDQICQGILEGKGIFGELKDTIKDEDPQGYSNMQNADISDDTMVYKVDGCWYYVEPGMDVDIQEIVNANESLEGVQQQTEGNLPNRKPIDSNYMQTSGTDDGEHIQATIVDDEDDDARANKEAAAQQMYQIIEDEIATIIDDDDSDEKPSQASTEAATLIEEANRIFSMPNSKFAGNYAIEHMPAPYKHIWSGLTDSAKATIAKQAANAMIATEAANLKFWANTDFIAIERACITAKAQMEAATESAPVTIESKEMSFMKRIFNKK